MLRKIALAMLLWLSLAPAGHAAGLAMLFGGDQHFCSACPSAEQGADVLCEDFHSGAATGLCGWTITEAGGDTGDINMAATPDDSPALGCADLDMTYAAYVYKANATATALRATKAISPGANTYVEGYIKIGADGLSDTQTKKLFGLKGTDVSVFLLLYQTGSTLYFGIIVDDGSQAYDWGGTAISVDAWYGFRVHVNNPSGTGSDSVQWWIDYNLDGSYTDEGTSGSKAFSGDIDTAYIASDSDTDVRTTKFWITGLKISGSSMPSDCAR